MKNNYIFVTDIETTGFSPNKNDIIELAGIIVKKEGDNLKYIDSFCERCRPYSIDSWTAGAEMIHKIRMDEAFTFQHPRKMLINLLKFLLPYKHDDNLPLLFICHAKNKFDYKFIKNAFLKEGLINSFHKVFSENNYESTIDLASKYKDVLGVDNLKLSTLADYFNVELSHHEAFSDANACLEIYKKLKNMGYQMELL